MFLNGCPTGSLLNLVRPLHTVGVPSLGCAGQGSRCGAEVTKGAAALPGGALCLQGGIGLNEQGVVLVSSPKIFLSLNISG